LNLRKLNRIFLQTMLLPVIVLLLVSGLLVWQILSAQRTVTGIQVADRNIASVSLLSALIADEETGVRGYQTTGNEIFLQPYEFAVGPLQDSIARLRAGLDAQGLSQRPVDDFVSAHQHWVDTIAEPMIDMVRNNGNTRDPGINLRGKANMDNMRAMLAAIADVQRRQRNLAADYWRQQVHHTLYAVIGLMLVAGILIGTFARSRLRSVSRAFQQTLEALRANTASTYESEQRLRATLSSIGDGVVVCDTEGRVEILNTVAQQFADCTLDQVLGLHVDEVLHLFDEATQAPIETPFALVKRTNQSTGVPSHALLLHPDGSETYVDCTGAPMHDRNGSLAGVVMVFRDVTSQRRTQTALMASEKLAVAGRLAATIAHEIHNPLDAVVNLIYLMQNGSTPEESKQFLDLAAAELDRVTQISRAMLGLYRESRTSVALNLKPVLESVLVLLDRQLANAQVTLYTDMPEDAIVTGYPAELRQVFTNLIANAAEASSPGSTIELTVRTQIAARSSPATRVGVLITITDHGSGVTDEDLDHLFQPFFTTKGEHGTGLGLWVSQGIIQKHGGTITIQSRTAPEEHGATVTVFLPRGEAELLTT
jgi:PAS domain S-box-containing protein